MTEPPDIRAASDLLAEAVRQAIVPAAVALVGDSADVLWSAAFGRLTFDADAPAATIETIFDLASLTKPLATTTLVLDLVERGRVHLDDPVARYFAEWRQDDRRDVTLADLLEHASGLPPRLLDVPPDSRREFEHDICTSPLAYVPRAQSIYSDLGFLLLGFLVADQGGASLDRQFDSLVARLHAGRVPHAPTLRFGVAAGDRARTAPTEALGEDRRTGRRGGVVHDSYAAALGGVAGHAGLFGTVTDVSAVARELLIAARGVPSTTPLLSVATMRRALQKSGVRGSSRALGWDTMLPTSSCGSRMSPEAFGHVGFTGTSLWIDPVKDRYFILLTNRACAGGSLEQMRTVRRGFHDALAAL